MTKKITDTDIKKLLAELAEHVPEIDPTDDEWLTFLKNFIAARPDVKIDKKFQKELRAELIARAAQLDRPIAHTHSGLWWKLGLTFAGGAAVCAAVVVPMLTHTSTKITAPLAEKMMARDAVVFQKYDNQVPPLKSDAPAEQLFYSDAGAIDKTISAATTPKLSVTDSPEFDQKYLRTTTSSLTPLDWEDVPAEAKLIAIAQKFLEKNEIDPQNFETPFVEKIWEINDQPRPPYAPEQLTVVFSPGVRVTINLRTKTVENLIFSTKTKTP